MSKDWQYQAQEFELEKLICNEHLIVWVAEAYNLADSAEILYVESIKSAMEKLSPKLVKAPVKLVWSHNVQRMLWGYAFENLFKAFIIKNAKKNEGTRKVPLEKIKHHDLLKLASDSKIKLSEDEKLYLKVCEKCVLWAGRYPLPSKAHHLLRFRRTMKSRSEKEVMYSRVSNMEFDVYKNLFRRLTKEFENQAD